MGELYVADYIPASISGYIEPDLDVAGVFLKWILSAEHTEEQKTGFALQPVYVKI